MYRKVLVMVALLGVCGFSLADAKVTPYAKLSPDQRTALDASQQRLAIFDRALQNLEHARRKGQVSRSEYAYESHDLTAYIAAEANFQNEVLTSHAAMDFSGVSEALGNAARAVGIASEFILTLAARALASSPTGYSVGIH